MTITDFCSELHNYFEREKYIGVITIQNGQLTDFGDLLQNNRYFRIVGSIFNDGVYKFPASGLIDEAFAGAVWAMSVPPAAIALLGKIQEWDTKYAADEVANSPYQSESFGGYSYSKASGSSNEGGAVTWQKHFKKELDKWRKI